MNRVNESFQITYNNYKQSLEELQSKIIELGHDLEEHDVVIDTLSKTDDNRKCYRMVGGALVESNVVTTQPILVVKRDNLHETIGKLKAELVKTASAFEQWKKDNKIQVVKQ
ncbi:tubulin-binding prefolding complex subunit GIM4 [Maudiozyma barnettii]|uniref:Similar to Saccharomyces cerevisiae YEL003W GIM4 Subunit of the heterohexameric cochaperone prefoldin complex which binds specifically to cytosolic chaperonin and transfers target proteins to it n=1 Tax=Maudiozyma barnettii TaxID=61262 RepID=A0A8H2VEN4_9SACH|nr:tubulin-binding prefolding complex subunit GIM4 [Kazachstania barnettii]CAB4254080.1 similar to Saccharomyces cerevisiae YEL003W GIM4 Subunit of the heterohexameric cochaperone prefoldin complex which binds specifically to cytosolic chaperonin and transfers target proteins to it [Kazachstania barnettii]